MVQLSAVILARVLAYVDSFDLGQGKVFFPELVPHIVDRYHFQKFPKTLEQFDESKGIEFLEGKIGTDVIQKLGIWDTLLVLETRTNTTDSKRILEEMLSWAAERFGLNYKPGMIKKFGYISDLTFYSDIPILDVNFGIPDFAEKLSAAIADSWKEPIKYESLNFSLGHDPLSRQNGIAPFAISRRAQTRFSENKYFSEAPLPTDTHLALLEEFEANIKRMHDVVRRGA